MKWIFRILLLILVIVGLPVFVFVATGISKAVYDGQAYGYVIGENRKTVYERALEQKEKKEIDAIHTWPKGEHHRPITDKEKAFQDERWVLIVSDRWWNNSITLTFKDNLLVHVYRHRQIWEVP